MSKKGVLFNCVRLGVQTDTDRQGFYLGDYVYTKDIYIYINTYTHIHTSVVSGGDTLAPEN